MKYGFKNHDEHCQALRTNRQDYLRGLAEFVLFLNREDRDAASVIAYLGRYGQKTPDRLL